MSTSLILHKDQQRALDLILEGKNVCITGPAGTGKTTLLQFLRKMNNVQLCAMTGCAAKLIGPFVRTLHSWAGIGLGQLCVEKYVKKIQSPQEQRAYRRWRQTSCLVIDEMSMLSAELMDTLDQLGRQLRNKPHQYFGGIQVVLVGDFFQLPPIGSHSFLFEWTHFHDMFPNSHIIFLHHNFRQDQDIQWRELLDTLRWGGPLSSQQEDLLHQRIQTPPHEEDKDTTSSPFVHLYSLNRQVDAWNHEKMKECAHKKKGQESCRMYMYSPRFLQPVSMSLQETWMKQQNVVPLLSLMIGAQVMLTFNLDFEKGLVNGSMGYITHFTPDGEPVISFDSNGSHTIPWLTIEMEEESDLWVQYMPLRLAWGLSIHKVQGQTFSRGCLDIGFTIFEYGQMYVALSRFKTLDGIFLSRFSITGLKAHPKVIEFYSKYLKKDDNMNKSTL